MSDEWLRNEPVDLYEEHPDHLRSGQPSSHIVVVCWLVERAIVDRYSRQGRVESKWPLRRHKVMAASFPPTVFDT